MNTTSTKPWRSWPARSLLTGLLLLQGTAMALEEPRYKVIEKHSDFELRQYAPFLVAEVEVEGEFDDVGSQAFRVLVEFIGGANRSQDEISMTAPVTQKPAGEKISMTAPVTQTPRSEDRYVVAFVMPSEYTRETLPEPTDPRIRVREVPERLVAARRYSGFWTESRYRAQEARLLDGLAAAGFVAVADPVYARYNPPFMPWFLRRNEVWVEVERRAD